MRSYPCKKQYLYYQSDVIVTGRTCLEAKIWLANLWKCSTNHMLLYFCIDLFIETILLAMLSQQALQDTAYGCPGGGLQGSVGCFPRGQNRYWRIKLCKGKTSHTVIEWTWVVFLQHKPNWKERMPWRLCGFSLPTESKTNNWRNSEWLTEEKAVFPQQFL